MGLVERKSLLIGVHTGLANSSLEEQPGAWTGNGSMGKAGREDWSFLKWRFYKLLNNP